jgi:hypothetical protein
MTFLHLFANYMAVTFLVFETLNKDRLLMILDTYYQKQQSVPSPEIVNANENAILGFGLKEKHFCGTKIRLGVSLKEYLDHVLSTTEGTKGLKSLAKTLEAQKFVIFKSTGQGSDEFLNIAFTSNHTSKDVLKAYCQAFHRALNKSLSNDGYDFDQLEHELNNAGWKTNHVQMSTQGWKGNFKTEF